jgi:hypothetical protein
MGPLKKRPAAIKITPPGSRSPLFRKWNKGEIILPTPSIKSSLEIGQLVSCSGQLISSSGPLLSGSVIGHIHKVIQVDKTLEVCLSVQHVQYPLTAQQLKEGLDPSNEVLLWLHFCSQDPCPEVGDRDGRLHVKGIQKLLQLPDVSHLVPTREPPVHQTAPPPTESGDPGAKALGRLASQMGFNQTMPLEDGDSIEEVPKKIPLVAAPSVTSLKAVKTRQDLSALLVSRAQSGKKGGSASTLPGDQIKTGEFPPLHPALALGDAVTHQAASR